MSARFRRRRVALTVLLTLGATGAQASGFAVPELSIAGLGLSNAMVANTSDAGALPYNPAAMAFLGKASVGGGLMGIKPGISVDDTFPVPGDSYDSKADGWVLSGMSHGHYATSDALSFGVSVNSPFGLETDWPAEAFGPGFTAVGAGGSQPTKSELKLISLSPSATYKINENAAISVGFDVYWALELAFNTANTTIESDGTGSGTGFHIAGLVKQGKWSAGASYFSSPTIDIDGTVRTGGMNIPAKTELNLPWRAQVGVGYQVNDALNLEFDITRTGWSKFDEIKIEHASLPIPPLVSSRNKWKDVTAYRFGATYALSPETKLRFGYSFDETPQDAEYFSARTPGADRHLFSVGASHMLQSGWEIEAGYMYVKFDDRTINTMAPPSPGDPNGSFLYNGRYESDVHLIGLGVSKKF